MSNQFIPYASLSVLEQSQFNAWTTEIQSIAQRSRSKATVKSPPTLRVLDTPTMGSTHLANTDGRHFKITRDLLPASFDLRQYFIAHELGHAEGRHPWISVSAGFLILAAALGTEATVNGRFGNHRELAAITCLLLAVVGIPVLLAYLRTMFFEWDADRRGARMIGVPPMFTGMAIIEQIRGPGSKAFYDNKRARLLGNRPSIWRPRS